LVQFILSLLLEIALTIGNARSAEFRNTIRQALAIALGSGYVKALKPGCSDTSTSDSDGTWARENPGYKFQAPKSDLTPTDYVTPRELVDRMETVLGRGRVQGIDVPVAALIDQFEPLKGEDGIGPAPILVEGYDDYLKNFRAQMMCRS
jgi:hypothetical protein